MFKVAMKTCMCEGELVPNEAVGDSLSPLERLRAGTGNQLRLDG